MSSGPRDRKPDDYTNEYRTNNLEATHTDAWTMKKPLTKQGDIRLFSTIIVFSIGALAIFLYMSARIDQLEKAQIRQTEVTSSNLESRAGELVLEINRLRSENAELTENLQAEKDTVKDKQRELDKAEESIRILEDTNRTLLEENEQIVSLQEEVDNLESSDKQLRKYNENLANYLKLVCKRVSQSKRPEICKEFR